MIYLYLVTVLDPVGMLFVTLARMGMLQVTLSLVVSPGLAEVEQEMDCYY